MTTTTLLKTTRFGVIEYSIDDVVSFVEGMIGFPDHRNYLILQHKEGSPFRWLQSVDNPALAFLVVEPGVFAPHYAPQVNESAVAGLELLEDTPYLVYTVVTIPKGNPEGMTLNLAGPIVINGVNRKAKQVVLENDQWPLKFQVVQPASPTQNAA